MSQTLKEVLNLSGEAAVLAQRGKLSYANASACALLGADCVGKSVRELFGADIAGSQGRSFIASISLGGHSSVLRVNRTDEGQLFFLSDGSPSALALNDPLLQSLRNSLMNVSFAVERLRSQTEALQNAGIDANLNSLSHSYYQLMRVTSNASLIYDYARDCVPFHPVRLHVESLCRACLDALRHHLPLVEPELDCHGELVASIDPSLFRQLLFNLLSNCLIHAGELPCIRIGLKEQGARIFLSVNDNGCGIPPEKLYTVFDRYRHSYDLSQMNNGPGFGLSAACTIARLHGGTLLLESRPEHGTAVRVSFHRSSGNPLSLRTQQDLHRCTTQDILVGMADCLPDSSFSGNYMD